MKILIPIDNFIKCDFEMYLSVLMQVKVFAKIGNKAYKFVKSVYFFEKT